MLLDRGRGYSAGEFVYDLGAGQLLRLVDSLPVGVGKAVGVGEPLREQQPQDDGESRLGRACAQQRGGRLLVELLLGLRSARVADGHLALLVRRRRLLDAEPLCPRRSLPVVSKHERAEQLHRVGVDLRLPPREGRAQVEIAGASGDARLVLPLPLLAARLPLGVVAVGGRALLARRLLSVGLRGGVRGDLLDESVRQPLRIGDVRVWLAPARGGEFE